MVQLSCTHAILKQLEMPTKRKKKITKIMDIFVNTSLKQSTII